MRLATHSAPLLFYLSSCAGLSAQPVIRYANILGGSDSDIPVAVTAASDGSIYITGLTKSSDFPAAKRLSASHDSFNGDLFVVKVDPTGAKVVYSVIVGAGQPVAMALDAAGEAFVAGAQAAADFPVTSGAVAATGSCFLFKLNAAGNSLVYSTRLGCQGADSIAAGGLAIDAAGNAYLTGYGHIATSPAVYQTSGFGPFAMKVNAQGTALVYSTYVPGAEADKPSASPEAIAIDAAGNAYITGSADPRTFPATVKGLPTEPIDPTDPTAFAGDVFVVKLSTDGAKVPFAAIFGGYGGDEGLAIVPDANGYVYVAGNSGATSGFGADTPFPTTPGVVDAEPGFPRGFLTMLTPSGDAFVFSTFLPKSATANCIRLQGAGVDVLTSEMFPGLFPNLYGNRLIRVSLDGTKLIDDSIISTMVGTYCGQGAGTFVLGAETPPIGTAVVSPNLSPIGSANGTNVWFSAIAADMPGAPQLNLSTGDLLLGGILMPDGSRPPLTPTVTATTGSQNTPLSVSGSQFVSVSPATTVTPASITVSAPQGTYTDRLVLFAPGAQDGLAIFPIVMGSGPLSVTTKPSTNGGIQLSAAGPNSPPVPFTLLVSSSASDWIFGSGIAPPVNFTLTPPAGGFPTWLSVSPMSGTTPAQIRIMASPAGLAAGFSGFCWFQLTVPVDPLYPPPIQINSLEIGVSFQMAAPVPPAPSLSVTPDNLTFRLTSAAPTASAKVHVANPGSPLNFTVGTLPTWLSVTPASGTTPADLTVTAAPAQLSNTALGQSVAIFNQTGSAEIGFFSVTVDELLPGYVGVLYALPMSYPPLGTSPPFLAPGALFRLALDWLLPPPASLTSYSFRLNGQAVPLLSYASGSFIAQVPMNMTPGTYTIDGSDATSQRVATAPVQVVPLAPVYIANAGGLVRAHKADGSSVDPANPVQPGDSILITLTGQGAVTPPLASGAAASSSVPSVPVLPVSAIIGGKLASIVSNTMSTSQAGVLDVWLTVPALSAGAHNVSVSVGDISAGTFAIEVASKPLVPAIAAGGILNSASYVPAISPGSLFSIFGTGFATAVGVATGFPLPSAIDQTSVTIGGKSAPLIYVSAVQINAQAPYELSADPAAPVVVSVNGVASAAATVPVVAAAPGIFEYGQNQAVVQNQDYSINGYGNGAAPGSYVMVYLTGSGQLDHPVATGMAASANPLSHLLGTVKVTLNGEPADVAFAGLTPGFAGLTQVNIVVPNLPGGTYFMLVSIDGNWSNTALLTVAP